jgi:hypothetical protein
MEPPTSWSLLTASLAVSDLRRIHDAWAFLVVQGLVRDAAGDRDAFAGFVRAEQARGPITGPSLACRIAGCLARAGVALPAGEVPDPDGTVAARRMGVVAGWRRGDEPGLPVPSAPRRKPWWKWW